MYPGHRMMRTRGVDPTLEPRSPKISENFPLGSLQHFLHTKYEARCALQDMCEAFVPEQGLHRFNELAARAKEKCALAKAAWAAYKKNNKETS